MAIRKSVLEGGVMNNDEAAEYIGCTPDTLRIWVSRNQVPHIKVRRLTRFRKADLDEWLDAHVVAADEQSES